VVFEINDQIRVLIGIDRAGETETGSRLFFGTMTRGQAEMLDVAAGPSLTAKTLLRDLDALGAIAR
jgi:hypothetical protein